ncbi:MAG TPA: DUF4267 domain-containing protein [Solirubrobacterales bacterium]|nr:DUF4267 domain-containing protein [Solirubrobacterales bacterium]
MLGGRRIDPLARQAALTLAAGRVGIGASALLATRPALRALGFGDAGPRARALAKLAGSRDLALGLLTVASRDDRRALPTLVLAGAVLDSADALALAISAAEPKTRAAGLLGSASGAAAALAGAWAWARMRD